jgi:hypothetical protein
MSDKRKRKTWKKDVWPSYEAARVQFRNLINDVVAGGVRVGEPIPPERFPSHVQWLVWLIHKHPDVSEKAQGGVYGFSLHDNGHGKLGFNVIGAFGRHNSFSLETALWGEHGSTAHDAVVAFRGEIRNQTFAVKCNAIGRACPETGVALTESNCEVDHTEASFENLLEMFLDQEQLTRDTVETQYDRSAPAGRQRPYLADRGLAARWCEFHWQHARLEALSSEGHRLRSQRRKDMSLKT